MAGAAGRRPCSLPAAMGAGPLVGANKAEARLAFAVAAAASLLVAVGLWGWQAMPDMPAPAIPPTIAVRAPHDSHPTGDSQKKTAAVGAPVSLAHATSSISRPATPAEIRLFRCSLPERGPDFLSRAKDCWNASWPGGLPSREAICGH